MIKKLSHKEQDVAREIMSLFKASYAIEAQLLGAADFPPLKRKLDSYMQSKNTFYGFYSEGVLAAATEVDSSSDVTHIQSLVVHPDYFRRGIGGALVSFIFNTYSTKVFTVETGAANDPATELYRKHGFKEILQYDTNHGVRKVRFKKVLS
ncbi:MAG: GNAT family N-acetyltransferase [Eudoraea sp.]|nr:GNAT family N-acetyltransferase [Eudoraea sp.]